jgi:hypothetical protein
MDLRLGHIVTGLLSTNAACVIARGQQQRPWRKGGEVRPHGLDAPQLLVATAAAIPGWVGGARQLAGRTRPHISDVLHYEQQFGHLYTVHPSTTIDRY